MLQSTQPNRDDAGTVWLMLIDTKEQSDAIDILKKVIPLILAAYTHIDDLQAEINVLKNERVK
jgi:hypothetical protein